MPAATRLLAAFVMLIGAFLVLVGVAVFSLFVGGQLVLAAVVATAGAAGLAAGGLTYWLLRRDGVEDEEPDTGVVLYATPVAPQQPALQQRRVPPGRRRPLRVHAMPVADLPPAYVDAVMRGAQARLTALKAQAGGADAR